MLFTFFLLQFESVWLLGGHAFCHHCMCFIHRTELENCSVDWFGPVWLLLSAFEDTSEELDAEDTQCHQELIGVLCWVIKLERQMNCSRLHHGLLTLLFLTQGSFSRHVRLFGGWDGRHHGCCFIMGIENNTA